MDLDEPLHSDDVEWIINQTGASILQKLSHDIATVTVTTSAIGKTWAYAHPDAPMTTMVEFRHVAGNREVPIRTIGSSPPGEVFCADKEFDDLLGKIVGRARQRQAAQGSGDIRGLAVDASRSGVDDLLELGRLSIDQWLPKIDLDDMGVDFIAVSIPRRGRHGPVRRVRASLLYENARVTSQQLGTQSTATLPYKWSTTPSKSFPRGTGSCSPIAR